MTEMAVTDVNEMVDVPPALANYEIKIGDNNWAVVLKTPPNRLARFLQLMVGIEWRRVV